MLIDDGNTLAFNNLKKMVIDQGFCTLCGVCEAACPVRAIKIVKGSPHRIYDCSKYIGECSICYEVCPHTEALLVKTPSLGYYRKVLLCQAIERDMRRISHGGVVTSLLTYALEKKVIDGAVFSGAKAGAPGLKPLVSSVPDDLLSAVEVNFFPSAVAKAFSSAVHEHRRRKIAFVGVPCHVLAIRKLEAWRHRLAESLRIVIGLFCLWTFSLSKLLRYLSRAHSIKASEVQRIALAEEYLVYTKKGVIRIPLQKIKPNVLNRCRTCIDFSSELADISVGGASPLEEWSTVIIRSRRGEDFFSGAIRHGVIKTMPIDKEPHVFPLIIEMATNKRKIALREIKRRKRVSKPIPPVMDHLLGSRLS
ncbi:MAG: Coenzyme F420 hydrogenase/dehydrogenase, beta subunit C-terminal domain [Candidatus Bathyarchaeia archaeon]